MSTTVFTRKGIAFLAVFALGGLLLSGSPASAQGTPPELKSLIDAGRKQLSEAHAANTDDAYRAAEATFDRAVQVDPKSGVALAYRGEARMERSGWLAHQGRLDETSKVMADAMADFDRAVETAPEDFQVRALRGLSYAQFPPFLGKGAIAQADLEKAIALATFPQLPGPARAQILYQLGRVYAAQPDSAKAQDSWKKAVAADPESASGSAAAAELKKLTGPPQALNPQGQRMPDRFPQLRDDVSPVIVSASVTLPGSIANPGEMHPRMKEFLEGLSHQPGLIAVHRLTSLDHPGMLVILTWWENKAAVNRWYYSDTHQSMIQWAYGERAKPAAANADATSHRMTQARQIAMELFTTLPGGIQYGGGIGPATAPGGASSKSKP